MKQRTRYIWLAVAAVATALLFVPGIGPAEESAGDGRPKVLTTFTVLADMTRQVAGDRVQVASITKPGAEIHGYEPTPKDLRRAAGADLVLENGMGLERWFEQFIDKAGSRSVTLTRGIAPIPIRGATEYAGKPNPHAWMSTENAKVYVENIRRALTELDPEGDEVFAANARRYNRQIDEIAGRVERELESLPTDRRALVTCEGAFSYLTRDFRMAEQYLWPVNAEAEGTPRQIADSVQFVRDREVPAVFCESTVSNKAQKQVAKESGANFGGTLYVDSLSRPGGPVPTYLDLLQLNADRIVNGLTGDTR
jgi:manganese transport system substrate-binding protein